MADPLDEVSVNYEEDGVVLSKELDRSVLSKGAWATVMFLYQDMNRQTGEYGPKKVSIRRYQKRDNAYQPRSKFNISSFKQAEKIVEALQGWIAQDDE